MSIGNRFGNIGSEKLFPILDPFMKREKEFREISFHCGLWRNVSLRLLEVNLEMKSEWKVISCLYPFIKKMVIRVSFRCTRELYFLGRVRRPPDQSFVRGLILPFVEFWRLWRFERAIKLQFGFATFHCPTTDSRFRKNTRRPSPPRRSNLIEFSPRNVTRDKTINKTIKVTDSNPIVGSIANYRITGDFWEKVLREGNLTKRI